MSDSRLEIINGRLNKKIGRLKKQRDHWKKMHDYYAKVISLQPHLETRYKSYQERMNGIEEQKQLARRVKEQEALIRILLNDKPLQHYEIDHLYSTLIKEEYRKMNESKK